VSITLRTAAFSETAYRLCACENVAQRRKVWSGVSRRSEFVYRVRVWDPSSISCSISVDASEEFDRCLIREVTVMVVVVGW
jgi:hypothetical protein